MMRRRGGAYAAAGAVALTSLVGCGANDADLTASSSSSPAETTTTAAGEPPSPGADPSLQLAEWQTLEVTDADGVTFALADLVGRPVFVEAFATWCHNCRRQLGDTERAAARAGDDAVFVALSVETSLGADDMAEYAEDHDFPHIRFAVMSPQLLAAMQDAFGSSVLNPPSTPHVSIAADGAPGKLVTGYDSPEEILGSLGLA